MTMLFRQKRVSACFLQTDTTQDERVLLRQNGSSLARITSSLIRFLKRKIFAAEWVISGSQINKTAL
jgi:hypothetical protein